MKLWRNKKLFEDRKRCNININIIVYTMIIWKEHIY